MNFAHARKVAALSWPLYAGASGGVVIAALVLVLSESATFRWAASLAILVTVWLACASFWAFHWMFDASGLLSGSWLLAPDIPVPERWVQINTGLEQTSLPLETIFPAVPGQVIDVYDPAVMTEPAIARARRGRHASSGSSALAGVDSASADLVVVMLAAHEIRDRRLRERFFKEVARIVSRRGRVVLVEHLRDITAAAVFGPGVFHFFPRSEWLELGSMARLNLDREFRITPFVRVFVFGPR